MASIEIVLENSAKGWILGKFADRIAEKFIALGHRVEITESPRCESDITLFMHFFSPLIPRDYPKNRKFVLVTHVDDKKRLDSVKRLHSDGVVPIFMSRFHAQQVAKTLGEEISFQSVTFGSDLASQMARPIVGIFSRCYSDGRKNENWLIKCAENGGLQNVHLRIVGSGWGKTAVKLRKLGVEVDLFDDVENPYPDYEGLLEIMRSISLYLYLGFDEGAMGSIDAYLLGKKMLISRQGFHTEFNLPEDCFFSSFEEFDFKIRTYINEYQHDIYQWSWDTTIQSLAYLWGLDAKPQSGTFSPRKADGFESGALNVKSLIRASVHRNTFVFVSEMMVRLIAMIRRGKA